MNTDLVLSLLEQIANLQAEVKRLHKYLIIQDSPLENDTFNKEKLKAFDGLMEEFHDYI